MNSPHRNRTTAATALAAMLAAGVGVAAIGTGAVALGGSAGAAIVTYGTHTRTVTLEANELHRAATDPAYAAQICADPGLKSAQGICLVKLPPCAKQWEKTAHDVFVEFDTSSSRLIACNRV